MGPAFPRARSAATWGQAPSVQKGAEEPSWGKGTARGVHQTCLRARQDVRPEEAFIGLVGFRASLVSQFPLFPQMLPCELPQPTPPITGWPFTASAHPGHLPTQSVLEVESLHLLVLPRVRSAYPNQTAKLTLKPALSYPILFSLQLYHGVSNSERKVPQRTPISVFNSYPHISVLEVNIPDNSVSEEREFTVRT